MGDPIFTLRVKCAPMTSPEGDKRYWHADHYGFSDDFDTPVVDATNGPYGPPPLQIDGQAATERYAGSLIGTVARLQGYFVDADVWRRVAVNNDGLVQVQPQGGSIGAITDPVAVSSIAANVNTVAQPPTGDYVATQVIVSNVVPSVIASSVTVRNYLRIDCTGGNLWVRFDNLPNAGEGILVTPTSPLTISGDICPITDVAAIATVAATVANITQRRVV